MKARDLRNVTIFESCLVKHFDELDKTELAILKALYENEKINFIEVYPSITSVINCEEIVKIDIEYSYEPYRRHTFDDPGNAEHIDIIDIKVQQVNSLFTYWLAFGFRYFLDEFLEIYKYQFNGIEKYILNYEQELREA